MIVVSKGYFVFLNETCSEVYVEVRIEARSAPGRDQKPERAGAHQE